MFIRFRFSNTQINTKHRAALQKPHKSNPRLFHSHPPEAQSNTVVFSGIQPTGEVHLGNYLGAIKMWVDLQNRYFGKGQTIISVVDLHSLTIEKNRTNLRKSILHTTAALLASGIDPKKSILFNQSQVTGHSELNWILSCISPMWRLNNMIQFKEKSRAEKEVGVGLFTYPILMASDILLYRTTCVPVGDDQKQHLEFVRDIAARGNRLWGDDLFVIPNGLHSNCKRIMSLTDPAKKMSKSEPSESSRISLTDTADQISSKIKKAKTDSIDGLTYDPKTRPEVANLIDIFSALSDRTVEDICNQYKSKNMGYFKHGLEEVIIEKVVPLGKAMNDYLKDEQHLTAILTEGAQAANHVASQNLSQIKNKIGFV